MPVIGDIAVSSNGRRLEWESNPAREWRQKTEASFAYSRNTYRYDRNAGFLDTIEIFASAINQHTIANLVRYHLLSRPNVALVYYARAERDPVNRRDWTVKAAAQLTTGEQVEVST